jgi:hypothetical protein
MSNDQSGPPVQLYAVYLCDLCVQGKGGECHSPGCALWISRAPDLSLVGHPMCQPIDEYLDGAGKRESYLESELERMRRVFDAACAEMAAMDPETRRRRYGDARLHRIFDAVDRAKAAR